VSSLLLLTNRQRTHRVNLPQLRRIARTLLLELHPQTEFDLAIHLLGAAEMTRLNETFLHHQGSTDVITFDYASASPLSSSSSSSKTCAHQIPVRAQKGRKKKDSNGSRVLPENRPPPPGATQLKGEIFICLDEALSQARRFRTSWPSEVVRYLVHGVLHLCGYDDRHPAPRREMKRMENRLLEQLARRYRFRNLAGTPALRSPPRPRPRPHRLHPQPSIG